MKASVLGLVATGIVGESAADDHRTQELAAFGDFCQRLVILEGVRVDRSIGVQSFAFAENSVCPFAKSRELLLKKLERLTIWLSRCG